MNLIARTKNSLEFNFISAVFFCLLFIQFFNNGTQLNIGIWQGKSDYKLASGESTYSQSSKSNSRNLGGSIGTNGLSANIGFSESQSSFDQTTFSNSQISAINGNLNINTNQDLKIFGANLVASNVNMNIGNNLLLKSKQNLRESDSYNIGKSIINYY
jgi:hypothetical protein